MAEKDPPFTAETLALLSHELRSPLTAVIGNADMLASGHMGALTAEQRDCAAAILERSQALLLGIEAALDLFGASLGELSLLRGSVQPAEVVEAALAEVLASAKRRKVTLHASVAADLHPCSLDRRRIQQSLAQLLGHAIQLSPRGGEIRVEARRLLRGGALGLLEIAVADFGPGIPLGELTRLLDGDLDASVGGPHPVGGLGLGLALVRAHAAAHGGRVELAAEERGSRVSILLPIEPA